MSLSCVWYAYVFVVSVCINYLSYRIEVNLSAYIEQLKIPVLNLVLCLVVYSTCFAFYCISAVLRDRCWFCCSILTATIIKEHYYDVVVPHFIFALSTLHIERDRPSKLECSQLKTDRCSC